MMTEERELRCYLTEAEKIERATALAKETAAAEAAEDEKSSTTKALGARIEEHYDAARRHARIFNQGWEHRMVKCEKTYNVKKGLAIITRLDTGEVVQERPMTDAEKQMSLKDVPAKPQPPATPEPEPEPPF